MKASYNVIRSSAVLLHCKPTGDVRIIETINSLVVHCFYRVLMVTSALDGSHTASGSYVVLLPKTAAVILLGSPCGRKGVYFYFVNEGERRTVGL